MDAQANVALYEFITTKELMDCATELSKELNACVTCTSEDDGNMTITMGWNSGVSVAIKTINPAFSDGETIETDELLIQGCITSNECLTRVWSKIDRLNKAYPDIKLYSVENSRECRSICIEKHIACCGGVSMNSIAYSVKSFILRYREIYNNHFNERSARIMH